MTGLFTKSTLTWLLWIILTVALATFLGTQLLLEDQKESFLIGQTTHGHYQIEMQCTSCHLSPFGGTEVLQNACENCHLEELRLSRDSHPRTKFTDPRNADTLAMLDARLCVTCHREHNAEITREMAVTLPDDYCFYCHEDIAQERVSHEGMAFDTCASSGCHNFHDNRALNTEFLAANRDGEWVKPHGTTSAVDLLAYLEFRNMLPQPEAGIEFPATLAVDAELILNWESSSHAAGNVGCASCHGENAAWIASPSTDSCGSCHDNQTQSFMLGKHGMRLAQNLLPMTPRISMSNHGTLAFTENSLNEELSCNSCHDVHSVDTRLTVVDSCLNCHADQHSVAFMDSPHGAGWQQFLAGQLSREQTVTCATCHMPATGFDFFGQDIVLTQHNQNETLRPNEKMIRPVCMNCHNLAFSIDALADRRLIENNFNGQPAVHIESIDMAVERVR